MNYHFYSMILRMKYVDRWGLMRNTWKESLAEHTLDVAVIAHALAIIGNKRFQKNLDPYRTAMLALFHDASEILTGDMPTPVKYYNEDMIRTYKQVEDIANHRLIEMLPDDFREEYEPLFFKQEEDAYLWKLVKAADKLSAYIKCLMEEQSGNKEFSVAKEAQLSSLKSLQLPEAEYFLKEFMDGFCKTLDEQ